MSGRHHGQELAVRWDRGGPQHRRKNGQVRTIAGVVAGASLLIATAVGAYTLASGPTCDQRFQLDVVAAAEIQPVLDEVARGFEAEHACVSIETRIRPPVDVAESIANMADRPDVWVPDASLWVDYANLRAQDGDEEAPGDEGTAEQVNRTELLQPMLDKGRSIARSPVILGAAPGTEEKLRKDGEPSWTMLIPGTAERKRLGDTMVVRLPTPGQYASGLAALNVLDAVADLRPELMDAVRDAAFELRDSMIADERTLFDVFAKDAEDDDKDKKDKKDKDKDAKEYIVVASEQAIWRYNRSTTDNRVIGVYPAEGALALDYPYVVTSTTATGRRLAQQFFQALTSPAGQEAIRAAGFRTPDGKGGPSLSSRTGLRAKEPTRIPNPDAATTLRGLLQARLIVADTRALLLIDVSGSMDRKVPGTKLTRAKAIVRLAEEGVQALPKGSEVGLWVFASKLDGDKDYRELVPIAPLDEKVDGRTHKDAVIEELRRLPRKTKGDTGLYDSVLAAFRAAAENPVPNKLTSIVVFTDGKNEDDDGISLKELLSTLRREFEPTQPVTVSIVGYGRGIEYDELRQIAAATNGVAKVAKDFDEAERIFLSLIAQRACMECEDGQASDSDG
ncbi:substrate-binding and VWA domain-containing protein [Thermopolyspora flexuosa]|uniref:von Willebrand factor type A domain-containing protein n=1 Tax=Thermopolyspora flexuosa TaxID=103836 RepID=A0A543ITF3_9ACTN|nr:substrate-binding and VWA domain-containing protein [Thermopolyspora flexuosa]TQM73866.1 von Willebrand factor type A domain-containing protein [Thermopolyspora flexuosa]